ncbi:hypothetical protein BC567DRAFT_267970 [Phyllosticta citribraziliensis]
MATLKKDTGLENELATSSEDRLDDTSDGSSCEESSDDSAEDRPAKRQKLEPSLKRLEEQRQTLEAKMRSQRSTNKQAMAMIRKRDEIISNLKRELKTRLRENEENSYSRKILKRDLKTVGQMADDLEVANHNMSLEMQDLKKTNRQKDSQIADLKSTIDKMSQENNDVKQNVLRAFGVELDSK